MSKQKCYLILMNFAQNRKKHEKQRGTVDIFGDICYSVFVKIFDQKLKRRAKGLRSYFENRTFKKVFYRCQKNDDCDVHFQRDIELIQVISGCLDMTVRDEKKLLTAGDIMIASGYESHGFKTVGSSEFRVFIIPAEIIPEYIACTSNKMQTTPFLKKCSSTDRITALLDMLIPYTNTEITLAGIGYIYAVLGTIIEEIKLVPTVESKKSEDILRKMLIYVDDHFREELKISDIANHFGYHKDYLSKIFNAGVGYGFNQYVNILRVKYAKDLIVHEKLTLDEICAASGFQSALTFRRAFIDYYGQTPREYRKNHS